MSGYLGIDESNNGGTLEFHVGVHSTDIRDIVPSSSLSKKKNGGIPAALGGRDFKYVLVDRSQHPSLKSEERRAVVISQLIMAFDDIDGLEGVLIDGFFSDGGIRTVEGILQHHGNKVPALVAVPNADTVYRIVNVADHVARLLYHRHLETNGSKDGPAYPAKLIVPDVRMYEGLVKRLAAPQAMPLAD